MDFGIFYEIQVNSPPKHREREGAFLKPSLGTSSYLGEQNIDWVKRLSIPRKHDPIRETRTSGDSHYPQDKINGVGWLSLMSRLVLSGRS